MSSPIKLALYRNASQTVGTSHGAVVYSIDNTCCVFSGIISRVVTSTINAAECIIKAICDNESITNPLSISFFDLQTHRGYVKEPGEYGYDQLHLKFSEGGLHVYCWEPQECPEDVQQLFRSFIGDPIGVCNPDVARFDKYIPTDRHSNKLSKLRKFLEAFSTNNAIIVDNKGYPEHLQVSGGCRYTVWGLSRDYRIKKCEPAYSTSDS